MDKPDLLDIPAQLQRIMALQKAKADAELRSAAAAAAAEPGRRMPTVQDRLVRKFGLGDVPSKRRKLYDRLAALVEQHDSLVLDIISEAVAESCGTRHPDRYFCRAVRAKLQHIGLDRAGSPDW
jgi:hypothetical protein